MEGEKKSQHIGKAAKTEAHSGSSGGSHSDSGIQCLSSGAGGKTSGESVGYSVSGGSIKPAASGKPRPLRERSFIKTKGKDMSKRWNESEFPSTAARGAAKPKPTRELYQPPIPPPSASPPASQSAAGSPLFSQSNASSPLLSQSAGDKPFSIPSASSHSLTSQSSVTSSICSQSASSLPANQLLATTNLNPAAKEFAPSSTPAKPNQTETKTALARTAEPSSATSPQDNIVLNRTGLTITIPNKHGALAKSRSVTTRPDQPAGAPRLQIDLSPFEFPLEMVNVISKALEDPNRIPGRSLMELVRQILARIVSGGSRVGSAERERLPVLGARLCMEIIEREQQETFLESLINLCQEWYHGRERVLRLDILRWNNFISFLTEMYGLLKRKQLHFLTRYEGVAPKLVLLSLLAECCTATLTSALNSLAEVETLFFVLTQIGKDLEADTPGRMILLVTCLREAFLSPPLHPQVRKTLLQLVELQAAGWNLPAQAVMYYYPGAAF